LKCVMCRTYTRVSGGDVEGKSNTQAKSKYLALLGHYAHLAPFNAPVKRAARAIDIAMWTLLSGYFNPENSQERSKLIIPC
jgi:hypothetical protein